MKIQHAESHVVGSSGLSQTKEFSIRTSAHAFKLLSSGLYSDKVSAVLREIGCNAADAHVAAGKSHIPFEVKLPNAIDPQFYIKDQGPGLSHDDVMGLYTTYFASTKQDSNDYTGAFGLGSKSPFSYTDSFTITSCHGGYRRIYSAFIGKEGSPNIALLSESRSLSNETGITISFPVKKEHFQEFANKAQNIFQYFAVHPTIIAGQQIKPLEFDLDNTTYAFLKNTDDYNRKNFIQMGNVHYPLGISALNLDYNNTLFQALQYSSCRKLLLRFPMGALQVAANREEIQYDVKTQKVIADVLAKIIRDVTLNVEVMWNKHSKTWLDKCEFAKMNKIIGNGFNLSFNIFKLAGVKDPRTVSDAFLNNFIQLPKVEEYGAKYSYIRSRGDKLRITPPPGILYYEPTLEIVAGADSYHQARMRKAFADQKLEHVLLVTRNVKEKGTQADVDKLVAKLQPTFPGIKPKPLSDFPAPVVQKITRKGGIPALTPWDINLDDKRVCITSIKPERRIYVKQRRERNYQSRLLLGKEYLDYHDSRAVTQNLDTLKFLGFVEPIKLQAAVVKNQRLEKRPDWLEYSKYLEKVLTDPKNISILKQKIKDQKIQINIENDGLLQSLIRLKRDHKELYTLLEPLLKQYSILDTLSQIKIQNSKNSIYDAYMALTKILELKSADFTSLDVAANEKYVVASEVTYATFVDIGQYTPELLPVFLETLLKKG